MKERVRPVTPEEYPKVLEPWFTERRLNITGPIKEARVYADGENNTCTVPSGGHIKLTVEAQPFSKDFIDELRARLGPLSDEALDRLDDLALIMVLREAVTSSRS